MIAFTAFLFEDNYFISFKVIHYACGDLNTFYSWGANSDRTVIISQKNAVEFNLCSFFVLKTINEDLLI